MAITPTQWSKRVEVTGTSPAATLSGYVALITEANLPADVFNVALNGGGDLRVCLNSDGTGQLPLEVVSFDNVADTAQLWIRLPTYSSSARSCWLFYGKAGETQPLFTNEFGRNSVWSDYRGVWHLKDLTDSAGNFPDSALVGNAVFADNSSTGAMFSTSVSLDGVDSIFEIPASAQWDAVGGVDFTLQTWVTSSNASAQQRLQQFDGDGHMFLLNNNLISYRYWSGSVSRADSPVIVENNTPLMVSGMRVSNQAQIYANTTSGTSGNTVSGNVDSNAVFNVGSNQSGSGITFWNGLIGEFRFRIGSLSSSHIETEYANQNAPNTFWTTGTPESTGGGEVTSDATINFAPFEFAGDASATLPQPESTVAFDLPEFTIAGNQSASLPQPTSSAAISFNALDFSGSQTATLPQPISTASFELPSFTVSGDISASVPANVVESSASFSLAPFEFSASQSASLPQPAISGAFTLPAFDITGSLSPGIPQPIISGGFDLPSFTFSGSGSVTLPQPISSGGFELPGITVLGAVSISGVVINVQNNGIIFLSAGNNSIQLSAGESLIYLH